MKKLDLSIAEARGIPPVGLMALTLVVVVVVVVVIG